uniref:Uncharacterized protein n=1 Tax=Urocitellus parryii TaxID=9999 RepID=A0A8D2HVR4_UROPR
GSALTWPPTSRLLALSLLTWDSAMSALSSASSSSCCTLRHLDSCVQNTLKRTYPGLQFLDLLLATLQGQLLSLIQTVLQVFHRLFQVLLHPLQILIAPYSIIQMQLGILQGKPGSIIPASDLCIQGALHCLHHPNVVSLQLVNFLIFFSNFPINFRLDLVQLKLDTQNLSLFMFKRCLNKTVIN